MYHTGSGHWTGLHSLHCKQIFTSTHANYTGLCVVVTKADLARQKHHYLDRDLPFILWQVGRQEPVSGQRAGHVEDPGGAVWQRPCQGDGEGGGYHSVTWEPCLQWVDHWRCSRTEVTVQTERRRKHQLKKKKSYT